MGLSTSAKNQILSNMVGQSNNISIGSTSYIGIGTLDSSGNFVEPSSSAGYYRTCIGITSQSGTQLMGSASNGSITNKSVIYLPETTASWGTLTHFGLFSSSSTSATPFFTGELTSSVTIDSGYIPIFRVGSLTLTIN